RINSPQTTHRPATLDFSFTRGATGSSFIAGKTSPPPLTEEERVSEAAILQSVRGRLSAAIQGFQPPPIYSINVSPWIAASALQKAIRRGHKQTALRAAARLLQVAPDRLWRRLGCISFEDVGVGDFEVVSLTVAALT